MSQSSCPYVRTSSTGNNHKFISQEFKTISATNIVYHPINSSSSISNNQLSEESICQVNKTREEMLN